MTWYSVQRRDRISVKGYGFSSFAKIMGKNIGKKSKSFSDKQSQKPLDHVRQSAKYALKTTSKRLIQKTAEKIADRIANSKKTRKNC